MAYFTAQAIARKLTENLQLSVVGVTVAQTLDSYGFPQLMITKNTENCFLKVEMIEASGQVDGLGMTQRAYSPHMITIIFDDAAAELDLDYKLIVKAAQMGTKVIIMNGKDVTKESTYAGALAIAAVVSTIRSNEIHPQTLSV